MPHGSYYIKYQHQARADARPQLNLHGREEHCHLSSDKPYHDPAILSRFCWHEAHSSERRKPNEASLHLSMVVSYMAASHAPDLTCWISFGRASA